MYALFTFEHRVAICFEIAISTAEVGAGDAAAGVSLIFASLYAVSYDSLDEIRF
jgi:UDP-N-acetylglucosamine enolpyruvyl transferase